MPAMVPRADLESHLAALRAGEWCPRLHRPAIARRAAVSRIVRGGQAPGDKEPKLGRPFAWTAGRTLFRWLHDALGWTEEEARDRIYLAAGCPVFRASVRAAATGCPRQRKSRMARPGWSGRLSGCARRWCCRLANRPSGNSSASARGLKRSGRNFGSRIAATRWTASPAASVGGVTVASLGARKNPAATGPGVGGEARGGEAVGPGADPPHVSSPDSTPARPARRRGRFLPRCCAFRPCLRGNRRRRGR